MKGRQVRAHSYLCYFTGLTRAEDVIRWIDSKPRARATVSLLAPTRLDVNRTTFHTSSAYAPQ